VVGGGPAGAMLAFHLARDGAEVTVFDHSHPREKPCGGGFTPRALDLLPEAPADDPLPVRHVRSCRFDSGTGASVELTLPRPVGIGSRRLVDAWLLRRAVEAGARHVAERVTAVQPGVVRTLRGREERFDLLVGADGASSLVRRTFVGPLPTARLAMAAGWFARGDAEMVVRFTPGLDGYLWLFPRPDHVGVGICAPLASTPTREMLARLEGEVARAFPALLDDEAGRYAHLIPSPTADPASLLEIAGPGFALVGDAAALADPITGEGIYFALRSAGLLAETLRAGGSAAAYPARAYEEYGRDLVKAAALRGRFFAPGFTARMVRYARRSAAIRGVLADLVLGDQGYVGLKRRLLRALPAFLWDVSRHPFAP
jgi:geranylgeranyl diphosphate/geranylgeranyl-bacteriochlorophyllide a reductase